MNPEKARCIIARMNAVLKAVRLQNSGADIHTIGNIRNTATLLIAQLEEDSECFDEGLANQIAKNVEHDLVDFFTQKYHQYNKRNNDGPIQT